MTSPNISRLSLFPHTYIYTPNSEIVLLQPIRNQEEESRSSSVLTYRISLRVRNITDEEIRIQNEDGEEVKQVKKEKKFRVFKTKGGECSICYKRIRKGTKVPMLKCKHKFHNKCLRKWVNIRENCPLCRQTID